MALDVLHADALSHHARCPSTVKRHHMFGTSMQCRLHVLARPRGQDNLVSRGTATSSRATACWQGSRAHPCPKARLRSEGSWLAASLQLSCCAPGSSPALLNAVRAGRAYARPAIVCKVRPALDPPARPACAAARARAHPPCPSPRALGHPFAPSHNPVCVQNRADLGESFLTRCCTSVGHVFFCV